MSYSAVQDPRQIRFGALAAVVGFLVYVEFTSGILQGFYTPLLTDIARHLNVPDADVNWLEGGQMMAAAIIIPAFAKLGDMIGHRRMLLISTALTAVASAGLPLTNNFWMFLLAWSLQAFYIALHFSNVEAMDRETFEAKTGLRLIDGDLIAFAEHTQSG